MKQKALDRSTRALQRMNKVKPAAGRPKRPTKAEVNKRFVLRTDRSGTPTIKEVT